jgi:hypothetical protein
MKHTTIIVAVGLALAAALPTAPATAQSPRTFVSPTGSDSNSCLLAAPCRTFQTALAHTNPGGEISVLGTAGYTGGNTLTIDKAISIVNPGAFEAGIVVPSGGNGIVINAGASDIVTLRGLTIEGGSVGTNGIVFNSGASLSITNSTIRNLTTHGIFFQPSAASKLFVSNTYIADLGSVGIYVIPSSGGTQYGEVLAAINRVEIHNAYWGIAADGANATMGIIDVSVTDSIVANGQYGFAAASDLDHIVTNLTVMRSTAANNGTGIYRSGSHVNLYIGQSTVRPWNYGGVTVENHSPGFVESFGDNYIVGNVDPGTLNSIPKQ